MAGQDQGEKILLYILKGNIILSIKVFMFVADKRVVGLLLAETIQQGFRILPHLEEVDTASAKVKICPIFMQLG